MEATVATEQEIQKIREQHAVEVEELKAKLEEMQKERNELLVKLKGNTNQNKLAVKLQISRVLSTALGSFVM